MRLGLGNIKKDIAMPFLFGAGAEYAMKTVAFNFKLPDGTQFKLPYPAPSLDAAKWFGQPHILAGVGLAVGIPMLVKKSWAKDFEHAAFAYLGGKFVSENFGVARSPFRTQPEPSGNKNGQSAAPYSTVRVGGAY